MDTTANNSLSSFWQKLKILSTLIATILIPVVIAFMTQSYTKSIKQNEIGVRYIEIAVRILETPQNEQIPHLRDWAIDVIGHYSDVPLDEGAKFELHNNELELIKSLRDLATVPEGHTKG